MYIEDALRKSLDELNKILIPASESARMENVKIGIANVIVACENNRRAKQKADEQKEEEHED